jgi:HlyD family secretion protein
VVRTDLAGTIVLLKVQEKEKVRRGYDGKSWRGRVEEIPDAVVGRKLEPQDPCKPEDTRVLLAKIALLEPTPLKLGQRVEIRID